MKNEVGAVVKTVEGEDGMAVVMTVGAKGRFHLTLRDLEAGETVATRIYNDRAQAEHAIAGMLPVRFS